MADTLLTKIKRRAWKQAFGEVSWIQRTGDFRTRECYGLIDRPNYAYGMLRAADCARYFGHREVTIIEFGVASGAGLLNMIDLAAKIETETDIKFNVVGFDTGAGLPCVRGYKDHPEIWNPGDFAMEDRDGLERKLGGKAAIIWGDIATTIAPFMASLRAPIGFVSIDVDIYSATCAALKCFTGSVESCLPAVSIYFDDVSFFFANRWAGELAAINEFNAANDQRKIDIDRSLSQRHEPAFSPWHRNMYVGHILDHPARQKPLDRRSLTIGEHYRFIEERFLF